MIEMEREKVDEIVEKRDIMKEIESWWKREMKRDNRRESVMREIEKKYDKREGNRNKMN